MDNPISFTLTGLFQWIFGVLVALVVFFLYWTFKQNSDDKKVMMDRINKHSNTLNILVTEHKIGFGKRSSCKLNEYDGDNNDK